MKKQPKGKYFDEFVVGEKLPSGARTITQTDIVNFAGLSGDFNPLHMDHEFGKSTQHGSIIAHGALTFSISTGLFNSAGHVDDTCIAFLGLQYSYKKVVKVGDTIHLDITVTDKHLSSKGGRGVVTFKVLTMNQHDEVVIDGEWKMLIAARPDGQ